MGRLLVADDEHFVRDVIKSVLEGEGWTVEEVGDSTGLMERFGGDAPDYDIVLLDVCMPGPPVEEAVGKIHASSPDTRILLTSGFSRNPRIDRLLRHRGVEFLSKPFSTQELLQKVDTLLPAVEAGAPGPCVTPTSQ